MQLGAILGKTAGLRLDCNTLEDNALSCIKTQGWQSLCTNFHKTEGQMQKED